jgi:hypothetical protein
MASNAPCWWIDAIMQAFLTCEYNTCVRFLFSSIFAYLPLMGILQIWEKNAKYTIHVVDNSQYHMNTLTIIQYPTISDIWFSSAIRDLSLLQIAEICTPISSLSWLRTGTFARWRDCTSYMASNTPCWWNAAIMQAFLTCIYSRIKSGHRYYTHMLETLAWSQHFTNMERLGPYN